MPFTNIRFVRASHRIHHFQSTNFILFLLFTASLFRIFFLLSILSFVFFFVSALLFPFYILYMISVWVHSAHCHDTKSKWLSMEAIHKSPDIKQQSKSMDWMKNRMLMINANRNESNISPYKMFGFSKWKIVLKSKADGIKTEKSCVLCREYGKYNFTAWATVSLSINIFRFYFLLCCTPYLWPSDSSSSHECELQPIKLHVLHITYSELNFRFRFRFRLMLLLLLLLMLLNFLFFSTWFCSQEMSISFRQRIKMDMAKRRLNWIYFISQTYLR